LICVELPFKKRSGRHVYKLAVSLKNDTTMKEIKTNNDGIDYMTAVLFEKPLTRAMLWQ
jgi:hypothetical protein